MEVAREFQHLYKKDELRPYAEHMEQLATELVRDLRPDSVLRTILQTFFPGGDK